MLIILRISVSVSLSLALRQSSYFALEISEFLRALRMKSDKEILAISNFLFSSFWEDLSSLKLTIFDNFSSSGIVGLPPFFFLNFPSIILKFFRCQLIAFKNLSGIRGGEAVGPRMAEDFCHG